MNHFILYNGEIHSLDEKNRIFEAVEIKNGKITALGRTEEIVAQKTAATTMLNLDGKPALPGLIDAHQHLFATGFSVQAVDLRVDSLEKMCARLKQKAKSLPPGAWVFGWGYDEARFAEKRAPEKKDLNEIDNPVMITRYCMHTAVVNDAAIASMANKRDIFHPSDSDEEKGWLFEEAIARFKKQMPPLTIHDLKKMALSAQSIYHRFGITAVGEAGIGFFSQSFAEYEALQRVAETGEWNLNVHSFVLQPFFQQAQRQQQKTKWLHLNGLKLFADGTISGQTAFVSTPYRKGGGSGTALYSTDELQQHVLQACRNGFDVAVHAIGDQAIARVLSAYLEARNRYPHADLRLRVEHASIMPASLREQMKCAQAIPVPQPALIHLAGDVYQNVLPRKMAFHVFPLRSWIEAGIKPAASSDSPIAPVSPFLGMFAASERLTKNNRRFIASERISLEEAVRMYTVYGAQALGCQKERGTLEIGKAGDIVILPKNFFHRSGEPLKETNVEMTIVNGQIVYTNANRGGHICEQKKNRN